MSQPTLPAPAVSPIQATPLASRVFDASVLVLGALAILVAVATMGVPELPLHGLELLTVPLIMVIARFPLVLDRGDGGIEVGFDSSVLMFLLCMTGPQESVLLWSRG